MKPEWGKNGKINQHRDLSICFHESNAMILIRSRWHLLVLICGLLSGRAADAESLTPSATQFNSVPVFLRMRILEHFRLSKETGLANEPGKCSVLARADKPRNGIVVKPISPMAAEQFVAVSSRGRVRFDASRWEKCVPKRFRMQGHTFEFMTRYQFRAGLVRVFRVRFPSPVKTAIAVNNTVHGRYFQPAGPGPHPGVICLHILGGDFLLNRMIANSLARQGIAALTIQMPYYGDRRDRKSPRRMIDRDPRTTAEGMRQAVLDVRQAAAWLRARPEVGEKRLGIMGISLGGIVTALAAEAEPRFRNVAIYLGGGGLGSMVWKHPNKDAKRFREQWLKQGGTRASFLKIISAVDPATYGHLLKNRRVLMVAARNDRIIPRRATLTLWNSIGSKPKLIWLNSGHVTAAWYLIGELDRLQRFFNSTESAINVATPCAK